MVSEITTRVLNISLIKKKLPFHYLNRKSSTASNSDGEEVIVLHIPYVLSLILTQATNRFS